MNPKIFASISVFLSLGFALIISEVLIRSIASQNLSGSWRFLLDDGLLVNRADARARHQWDERVVYYQFNEMHMRADPIDPDAFKVLVLGDSYTFGWLVERENTFVGRLQARLDEAYGEGRIQLLNAACGGWGTGDYLRYLETFGEALKPDAVWVILNADDIKRSMQHKLYTFEDGELVAQNLQFQKSTLKLLIQENILYQWLLEHSHLLALARHAILFGFSGSSDGNANNEAKPTENKQTLMQSVPSEAEDSTPLALTPKQEAYLKLGDALFLRLHNWCEARGIPLWVGNISAHMNVYLEGERNRPDEVFYVQADRFFNQLGVPVCNTSQAIEPYIIHHFEDYTIPGDYHPNEAGHEKIADAFDSWLMERVESAKDKP